MQTSKNPEKIKQMFASVAHKYDKANSVLSLGIHHMWRKSVVKFSGARPGMSVLDCATGTGDLAIEFKKTVGAEGKVIGLDFCKEMLDFAPQKAKAQNLEIEFVQGDVMNLPYPDNTFDIVSISFGIRNVSDTLKGLTEMARVLKPGGKIMVLEFGKMDWPVVGTIYNYYSQNILPKIGGLVTGQKEAYEYLQKSSNEFPSGQEFVSLLQKTGLLTKSQYKPLSFGIAYLYKSVKLPSQKN